EKVAPEVEDDIAFFFGRFAVWIETLEFDSLGFGAVITVFFHNKSFASETRKSIKQPGIIRGIMVEPAFLEGLENLSDGKLNDGLLKFGFVVGIAKGGGGFALSGHLSLPILFENPVLVAAVFPIGYVFVIEGDTEPGKAVDNDGAGGSLGEHVIKQFPEFLGEFGYFSVPWRAQVEKTRF